MAIYSTFFLCEPAKLAAGFPGWRLPLPEPIVRNTFNPFTREPMTITTREPGWEGFDPANFEMPDYQVVSIEGNYQTYLNTRIPPFLQSLPHWCAKGLTTIEMSPLANVVMNCDNDALETPLYAHPSIHALIEQFPVGFPQRLQVADEAGLQAIAAKWAATMSTPYHTHSVDGERVNDDWSVDEAIALIIEITDLARKVKPMQSMYLLNEW